jgi:ectoine hydroxylase-related dioxygenase (phytanoyl-CoA dioxygenase family)
MSLTAEQIARYRSDGYLIYGTLLSPREVEILRSAYMDSLDALRRENRLNNIRAGTTADGQTTAVYQIRVAHLCHPRFRELLFDSRLLDIVERLIGPDIRLVLYQGLYKPPFTGGVIGWHQDDYYFRVNKPDAVVSCWLALDDTTVSNGCMWVLPTAHRTMLDHVRTTAGGFEIRDIDGSKAIPIELTAGQCLFHHGAMPHRTLANMSNLHRRALALHFMDATAETLGEGRQQEPPENMPLLRGRQSRAESLRV